MKRKKIDMLFRQNLVQGNCHEPVGITITQPTYSNESTHTCRQLILCEMDYWLKVKQAFTEITYLLDEQTQVHGPVYRRK